MATIRKRLSCVNRGSGIECARKNETAIYKIIDRYLEKMFGRGWLLDQIYTGDSFLQYEAIIYMYKGGV